MRTHSEGNAPNHQTPDTKEKTPPASRVPRGLKNCPESFLVTSELQQWARGSVPLVDIRAETAIFRGTERRTAITDWPKAWKVWMLREQKRHAELARRTASSGATVDVGYGLETPKQRAARERAEEISGGLASRKPTPPFTFTRPEHHHAIADESR